MPRTEMLAAMGFPAAHAEVLGHTTAVDLTATGANQADAYQITAAVSAFNNVAAGTGAKLPRVDTWKPGFCVVCNLTGTNEINLYPASGEYIYNGAVNGQILIPVSTLNKASGVILFCAVRSNGDRVWCVAGLAV